MLLLVSDHNTVLLLDRDLNVEDVLKVRRRSHKNYENCDHRVSYIGILINLVDVEIAPLPNVTLERK